MESITLGQVMTALAFILLFISNLKSIIKEISNPIDKKLEKALEPIKKEISDFKKEFSDHKIESVKRDLVNLMGLAEQNIITEEQKKLAHELMDIYTDAGLNSYVHAKWEKLEKAGKI